MLQKRPRHLLSGIVHQYMCTYIMTEIIIFCIPILVAVVGLDCHLLCLDSYSIAIYFHQPFRFSLWGWIHIVGYLFILEKVELVDNHVECILIFSYYGYTLTELLFIFINLSHLPCEVGFVEAVDNLVEPNSIIIYFG